MTEQGPFPVVKHDGSVSVRNRAIDRLQTGIVPAISRPSTDPVCDTWVED